MLQKPEETFKDLKNKDFKSIYFLHGKEGFYIDQISDFIEKNALKEEEKGFNQILMYGKDANMGQIINNARRFPMMAERQVLIVKEFQDLPDLKNKDALQLLEKYIENPLPSTILVLCHKHETFDKRKAVYKIIEKNAVVIETKEMYDNQLPQWIENYAKQQGYNISAKASALLAESVGNNLIRLSKEIDKISINLKENELIDEDIIQKFVGISKEYNVFELQKAITDKDILKANIIANYWEANPKGNSIIPVISMLFQFFTKVLVLQNTSDKSDANLARILGVNPFFVKDYVRTSRQYNSEKIITIIGYLRYADLQSKGVEAGSMSEGDILRDLLFRILH